jgi:2-polyprenyl-6-methoxyphenol hydroxylase-like FAD-dependent oxidoreductase
VTAHFEDRTSAVGTVRLFQHNFSWMNLPTPEDIPDSASRLAWWKSRAAEYADPWRTVGVELPEDLDLGIDRIRVRRLDMDWSQTEFGRRVTIVGDAAHCMPPHRGQGLNNALHDSATLVEVLVAVENGEKILRDVVEAYEKEMKELFGGRFPSRCARRSWVMTGDN